MVVYIILIGFSTSAGWRTSHHIPEFSEVQLCSLIRDTWSSTSKLKWSGNKTRTTTSVCVVLPENTHTQHAQTFRNYLRLNSFFLTHSFSVDFQGCKEDFLLLMRSHALNLCWGRGWLRSAWLSISLPIAFSFSLCQHCACECVRMCLCQCVYQHRHTGERKQEQDKQTMNPSQTDPTRETPQLKLIFNQ